jgi:hypothetical protein
VPGQALQKDLLHEPYAITHWVILSNFTYLSLGSQRFGLRWARGWHGYNGLAKHGYTHIKKNVSESRDPAHVVMPGVHRISALLKRWLLSTHQGAVSDDHLDCYLDE